MATLNFNADEQEPMAPLGAWTPAKQKVVVEGADVKKTKSGDGEYVEIQFRAVDGPNEGRAHWERYNISNPNQEAERIAKAAFASLCLALGVPKVSDTDQLIGRACVIETRVGKRKDTQEDQTKISGYYEGSSAPAAPPAARKPAAGASMPWQKAKATA